MSLLEPTQKVCCDKCGYEAEYDMCACVQKSWDNRYLQQKLDRDGWKTDGNTHICDVCLEDERPA